MFTQKRNTWVFLILTGFLLAASPHHDALEQTKTDRQLPKRIYVGFSNALGGTSGTLHAMKLGDVLKRTTTASLPKGPQGGVEVTFVAVIARDGRVLTECVSNPVRIDGTSLRRVDNQLEVVSPWGAFDNPICGFQEPLVGFQDAFLEFGKPIHASTFTYDERLKTTADAMAAIWVKDGVALGSHEYTLVLMIKSPRDAASDPMSVRPAVVPFSAREAASR